MMLVLSSIVGGIAVLAWGFAVFTLIQIVSLAPAGQKLTTLFDLGWWKFDAIKARIGAAAEPLVRNYIGAFLAFFVCVLLIAGVSILLAMEQRNGAPEEIAFAPPIINSMLA